MSLSLCWLECFAWGQTTRIFAAAGIGLWCITDFRFDGRRVAGDEICNDCKTVIQLKLLELTIS